jgi:hypothetical protein
MYPAAAYTNGIYTFEDLPDEVEFWHNDGEDGSLVGPIILPKNESAGEFFYGSGGLNPRISHVPDEWIVGVNQIDPGLGNCLILDRQTNEPTPAVGNLFNIWVFDRFADTYKITAYRANNEIQWIYTVERVSLCRWEYQIPKGDVVSLIYNDGVNLGPSFSPPHKWLASDDQEWSGIKSGFSNTPVGTYPDAWNLEVGGRIEVEEL